VALVVLYHLWPTGVPGGFLGVDVFFVLSGFLITSLIVDEVAITGGVDLRAFYLRRLRRLAPALLLVIVGVCAYAAWFATVGELSRLREHALWTLGYLANWKFILDGTTYTDVVAGQSPLRHAWSLAIEEQFYVVFPALALVLGRLVGWKAQRLRRALLLFAGLGAVASAVWMARLWGEGADPSRGYFGTDTRAQSLLVGVALGALLVGRPPKAGWVGRAAAVAGAVGVVLIAAAVVVSDEASSWLQHGGFLVVALAVAAVISAVEQAPWLRRALSLRPLVGLGLISYGVYLWHWPVVVLVDESRTGLDQPLLLGALRLGLTLGLALVSFHLVEQPVRRGAVGRLLGASSGLVVTAAVGVLVLLVVASTSMPAGSSTAGAVRSAGTGGGAAPDRPEGAAAGSGPMDVVIFGDSVAHTLAGGRVGDFPHFEPWSPELSPFDPARVHLLSVAKPACSYLPGELVVDASRAADLSSFCGDWQDDLRSAVRPGTVVLVALANDASDRRIDGHTIRLGTAGHAALLDAFLDEVAEIAGRKGATIVLVALPPRTGSFATELDEDGRRDDMMREELRAYARAHPGVALIDLFEEMCPAGDCDHPAAGFQAGWRYDGMHYTTGGAIGVAAWLTNELAALAAAAER
jgi:peptidoglycan/LPS O-acetylase OafA/YrhL